MQNHYNYAFDSTTNAYIFATKNNILYRIAFIVDETFSTILNTEVDNIFQLVVEKLSTEIEPFDPIVSKTIVAIIEVFFKNTDKAILYICLNSDSKASARFQLFHKWYMGSKLRSEIIKLDESISYSYEQHESLAFYASILIQKRNANLETLIDAFHQIKRLLSEEK